MSIDTKRVIDNAMIATDSFFNATRENLSDTFSDEQLFEIKKLTIELDSNIKTSDDLSKAAKIANRLIQAVIKGGVGPGKP